VWADGKICWTVMNLDEVKKEERKLVFEESGVYK